MANTWFKMYGGEYLNDSKIKSLSPQERSCWITVLCYASISKIEGEIMLLTEKQIMIDSGIDPMSQSWTETAGVLKRFVQLGMIEIMDSGIIKVTNWAKRQDRPLSGYDRIKRHRERKKATAELEGITQSRFDEFWNAYPRKVSKQTAQRAWERINPDQDLHAKIISALAEQSKSAQWTKDDGRFIPHPTTWLNQERWNDELKSKPQIKSKYL